MATIEKDMLLQAAQRFEAYQEAKKSNRNSRGMRTAVSEVRRQIMTANTVDTPQQGLEKIRGTNNLTSISFLLKGYEMAQSVGLIFHREKPVDNAAVGTGFLVAPGILVTNHHVLESIESAENHGLRMNYHRDLDGEMAPSVDFKLLPKKLFFTDKHLDVTFVAVSAVDDTRADNLATYGYLRLFEAKGKISEGEFCTAIQHPDGRPKQLPLFENKVLSMAHPEFFLYESDTVGGSSGSPVFNYEWVVVGIHHAGIPVSMAVLLEKEGNKIGANSFPTQGNEGIRISAIMALLLEKQPVLHKKIQAAAMASRAASLPIHPFRYARVQSANTGLESLVSKENGGVLAKPISFPLKGASLIQQGATSNALLFQVEIPIHLLAPKLQKGTKLTSTESIKAKPTIAVEKITNSKAKKTKPDGRVAIPEANRIGFNPNFLEGLKITLLDVADAYLNRKELTPLLGSFNFELKYTNFSVFMHQKRRMCLFAAVNINGNEAKKIKRTADKWFLDGRLDVNHQLGESMYSDNDLDIGHIVRREDPNWGANAEDANYDTFFFTNACPQHKDLNRKDWLALESYVLNNTNLLGLKVSVITGPILDENVVAYREANVPAQFFKVVFMIKTNGEPSVTGYVLSQRDLISGLEKGTTDFVFSQFKTYQVSLDKIQAMTGLNFEPFLQFDPLFGAYESVPTEINGADDLRF